MKISSFTKKEIDYLLSECNFTELEESCFKLKAKDKSNVQLALELNVCESTVSSTMKSVRAKITSVLEQRATEKPKGYKKPKDSFENLHPMVQFLADFLNKILESSPLVPESHTTKEWAEMPDKVSVKDKLYVWIDYRTDDDSPSVPRLKYGDGVTMVSQLPFCTASITDNDVRLWDLQMQITENTQKLKKTQ